MNHNSSNWTLAFFSLLIVNLLFVGIKGSSEFGTPYHFSKLYGVSLAGHQLYQDETNITFICDFSKSEVFLTIKDGNQLVINGKKAFVMIIRDNALQYPADIFNYEKVENSKKPRIIVERPLTDKPLKLFKNAREEEDIKPLTSSSGTSNNNNSNINNSNNNNISNSNNNNKYQNRAKEIGGLIKEKDKTAQEGRNPVNTSSSYHNADDKEEKKEAKDERKTAEATNFLRAMTLEPLGSQANNDLMLYGYIVNESGDVVNLFENDNGPEHENNDDQRDVSGNMGAGYDDEGEDEDENENNFDGDGDENDEDDLVLLFEKEGVNIPFSDTIDNATVDLKAEDLIVAIVENTNRENILIEPVLNSIYQYIKTTPTVENQVMNALNRSNLSQVHAFVTSVKYAPTKVDSLSTNLCATKENLVDDGKKRLEFGILSRGFPGTINLSDFKFDLQSEKLSISHINEAIAASIKFIGDRRVRFTHMNGAIACVIRDGEIVQSNDQLPPGSFDAIVQRKSTEKELAGELDLKYEDVILLIMPLANEKSNGKLAKLTDFTGAFYSSDMENFYVYFKTLLENYGTTIMVVGAIVDFERQCSDAAAQRDTIAS